ncbi:MAG: J domain-containing protein [Candidatus Helarchaeota archaeon]
MNNKENLALIEQFKKANFKQKKLVLKKYSKLTQNNPSFFKEFYMLFLESINNTELAEWAIIQSEKILQKYPEFLDHLIIHYHNLLKQKNLIVNNRILDLILKFFIFFQKYTEFDKIILTCKEILTQIQTSNKSSIDIDVEIINLKNRIIRLFDTLEKYKYKYKKVETGRSQQEDNEQFTQKEIDPFKILNISPTAPFSVIKKRFYDLLKMYHPDRNPGFQEEANQKTKLIIWAFEQIRKIKNE